MQIFLTKEEWDLIEQMRESLHIDFTIDKGSVSFGTRRGHRYPIEQVLSALLTSSLAIHREEIDEDLKSRRILAVAQPIVAFADPVVTKDPGTRPTRRRRRGSARSVH